MKRDMGSGRDKQIGLRGIVTPELWNERGDVIRVSIQTRDEQEYVIDPGGEGAPLLKLVTREVVVWGTLGKLPDGTRILRPVSHAVIEPRLRRTVPA